jgi:hypothetical protein
VEKVFALRDLSSQGLGIDLSEHGEVLLFPLGQHYSARLNLGGDLFAVELEVKRIEAANVGFKFLGLGDVLERKIEETVSPLRIAATLKSIRTGDIPESFREGVDAWFHGEMNTDLFFWIDGDGLPTKVVLLWNGNFWEWTSSLGTRTGEAVLDFNRKIDLHPDPRALHSRIYQARKILENAEEVDYRWVEFLLKQD